jgi:hypothetical protein
MAGIRNSSELRGYASSEWKADVGFLAREFEIQRENEISKRSAQPGGLNETSTKPRIQFVSWIFGRHNAPRH